MAITLSQTFAQGLLEDVGAGGTTVADQVGSGSLVIYSGTAPDGANEALGQHATNTALATFALSGGSSQSISGLVSGEMVLNLTVANQTVTASATGTAVFFRILNSTGSSLIQGAVATTGGDWNLSSTSIAQNNNVTITGTPSISLPVT